MTGYGTSASRRESRTNGLAVAGLVCGIVGLIFFSSVLGPLAIVFGAVGMKQAAVKGGRGMAKAALILGIVDLVIFGVLLALAASNGGFSWYVGS
ncbi:DUF4190 domain-containing protein [Streptomyces sp. NPDC050738]|uniref:DUF4190 domain-containing protein n=1 Tax=Streptomyces sp. NPDC050738 TaxID=3154744 RepID=UPI003422D18E